MGTTELECAIAEHGINPNDEKAIERLAERLGLCLECGTHSLFCECEQPEPSEPESGEPVPF